MEHSTPSSQESDLATRRTQTGTQVSSSYFNGRQLTTVCQPLPCIIAQKNAHFACLYITHDTQSKIMRVHAHVFLNVYTIKFACSTQKNEPDAVQV